MNNNNNNNSSSLNNFSREEYCKQQPYKIVVLLGPPGAGKTTHTQMLFEEFCYCVFSTGNIIRNEIAKKTELGLKVKEVVDKGELISNEIAYKLLKVRSVISSEACKYGMIMDGFPRTTQHADYLKEELGKESKAVDLIINYKIDFNTLYDRIGNRSIHSSSGRVYNSKHNPPKTPGIDDITGEPLIKRNDDIKENVLKRYNIFLEETKNLIQYPEYINKVYDIDATGSIQQNFSHIKNIIRNKKI